jgi:hypothetical protein
MQKMVDLPINSPQRTTIEKSQIYLGYKILWVVKLFLSGKKFPQGNIRDKKWRTYIHDIVEFVSTKGILDSLLTIDAESFFQIISVLFYEGKVYDFMKMGRMPVPELSNGGGSVSALNSMTHKDFLMKLDAYCQSGEPTVTEAIKLSYLFFVANVVAKSPHCSEGSDPLFYYSIVKELLRQHKKFLIFNKHLLVRAMSKNKLMRRLSREMAGAGVKGKIKDDIKHVFKCEADLVHIMQMCEPMDTTMINELLKLAEFTQL